MFSIDDKLKCLRRELALRRNVYPGLVRRGKMAQIAADREIDLMTAIVADYEALSRRVDQGE